MSWTEERRADRAAAAEQARLAAGAAAEQARADADAATERRLREQAARAELAARQRADRDARRAAARDATRARRAATLAGLRGWVGQHRVDLLIYPLAIASAVMAVPSMAGYGIEVYGGPTGAVLPVLSELGMWAFALAVQARRAATPGAPVWALQAGVWTFAAVAAGLNLAHGLAQGVTAGLVMGVASVAGVIAHQLVTAGGLRTRAERRATREANRAERKVRAARRAAVRAAVAQIDADGAARLVVVPGVYRLTRHPLTRRPRLSPATVPGLPVTPAADSVAEDLAAEAAAWLADQTTPTAPRDHPPEPGQENPNPSGGGVATLDPDPAPNPTAPNPPVPQPAQRSIRAPRTRSIDQLRTEFLRAVAAGRVDPTSAESIRTTLRCSPARARQLRDEHARSGGDQR